VVLFYYVFIYVGPYSTVERREANWKELRTFFLVRQHVICSAVDRSHFAVFFLRSVVHIRPIDRDLFFSLFF